MGDTSTNPNKYAVKRVDVVGDIGDPAGALHLSLHHVLLLWTRVNLGQV